MDGGFCFKNGTFLSKVINETTYITHSLSADCHRLAVTSLLRISLPNLNLVMDPSCEVNEHGYARQLIYADPCNHFSLMALRWMPGACTPIHGHNAWGCVGVLSGEIGCETYDHKDPSFCQEKPEQDYTVEDLISTGKLLAGPGTVASVDPDPCGIHKIFNPTRDEAVTVHIYGMNLASNPDGLNKFYEH